MTIVTDAEIIAQFRVTKKFINTHAPKWGAFSRPRKHILEEVEKYIQALSEKKRLKYFAPAEKKIAQQVFVNGIVNEVFAKRARKVANG